MNDLSIEQRRQLTDYYLGLLDESQAAQVQQLLGESAQAREFIKRVEQSLEPLKSLPEPQAPDSLVALTLARVRSAAALEPQQNAKGLSLVGAQESAAAARPRLLRFPELITIAASIALVVGLLVPAVRHWRQMSLRQNCALQQASIGMGMSSYAAAHDGKLPQIAEKQGQRWMRLDRVGPKRTDTSNLFLLVKSGYSKPELFVCPWVGHKAGALKYPLSELSDFPSESVVSYSYQNMFGLHRVGLDSPEGFAILADRNPLLKLGPRPTPATLFLVNISPNHGRDRGQNVLRLDWSVSWTTTAQAGFRGDNIWRPADFAGDASAGLQGLEVPANREDSFLGP